MLAAQQLLVGLVLLWAGALKLRSASPAALSSLTPGPTVGEPPAATRSALPLLVGESRAVPVYRAVGALEVAVAAPLLAPPAHWAEPVAAAVLAAGFVAFLLYSRRAAPERPCGCLGGHDRPVSRRSVARAALLGVFAATGIPAQASWLDRPTLTAAVVAVETLALLALSPELDAAPVRRFWSRVRGRADCGAARVPIETSVRQLEGSEPYQAMSTLLTAGWQDQWRDGCWRFLAYPAAYQGTAATAVFAVPLRHGPTWVRAAVVADKDGEILLSLPARSVP